MTRDAGAELRKALGLPEPNYGPGYQNPAYFGGFRNAEDQRDFAEREARIRAAELAADAMASRAA